MNTSDLTLLPMARVEMVAIDLDGTLLRSDKRLSKRVINAVTTVSNHGIRVVLASARPPRAVRQVYECLGLQTLQINYNGALIQDPRRNRYLFHQPLETILAQRLVRVARRTDRNVAVSIEILDRWFTDRVDYDLPTETSRSLNPDFIGDLNAFLHVPVTKLMFLAPPDRLNRVRKEIQKRFCQQVMIHVSDKHLIQIVHPQVDKAMALAHVARRYNVIRQNIMAIGDAPNDVGMLRFAGLGVAMGNAWEVTRSAADVVVPSNDEDGVMFALHEYVLDRI